jgi:hypothetical protein
MSLSINSDLLDQLKKYVKLNQFELERFKPNQKDAYMWSGNNLGKSTIFPCIILEILQE